LGAGLIVNSELEAYFASVRNRTARPQDAEARRREQSDFTARFLKRADSILKPVLESTAETLHKHGYGATVELVRDQSGSDPNTFPYVILYFSPRPCPAADLGYVYTLAGASVTFICRRDELCVEAVVAHPAGRGVERRVNFSTLALPDLTSERVTRIVTDAVKQIIRF
jgi:hypothetical protein